MSDLAVPPGVFAPAHEAILEALMARIAAFVGPVQEVAVGWATVDLDRAEAEQAGGPTVRAVATPDDTLLGARCRLLPAAHDGRDVVLLEPSTEGRLAASLARFGEGPAVLYLRIPARTLARLRVVAPASGVHCSKPAPGPFGTSVLVLDSPSGGPHLIVTEAAATGTIGR